MYIDCGSVGLESEGGDEGVDCGVRSSRVCGRCGE